MCTSNVSLLCHHLRRDLFCAAGLHAVQVIFSGAPSCKILEIENECANAPARSRKRISVDISPSTA
jgi:hypothetical protein